METYIMNRFESIGEFVKASRSNARSSEASHAGDRGGYGDNWHGTKTFDQSVEYALNGTWDPGELLEFRSTFDHTEAKLRTFVADLWDRQPEVTGGEVNVAAFLEGEPECMFEFRPDPVMQRKHALCLVIGHSISAGCTSQELFIRGQAAIALVRALSMLGYELEVWSEETVRGTSYSKSRSSGLPDYFTTLVRLHGAGQVMDESAVEFSVGNPSWLRRLLFGFQEGQSDKVRSKFGFGCGGYGGVVPIQHADTLGADLQLDLGRTWFSEGRSGPEQTAEDGMRWVVEQLKELGVIDKEAEWDD